MNVLKKYLPAKPRPVRFRDTALLLSALCLVTACAIGPRLTGSDRMDPDKLLAARQQASGTDRERAIQLNQRTRESATQGSDAATLVKAYSESVSICPTSTALVGLAEFRARLPVNPGAGAKQEALQQFVATLRAAKRLNAVDNLLSVMDRQQLIADENCALRFLAKEPPHAVCRPLEWIGLP